jgi:hypothetical protein
MTTLIEVIVGVWVLLAGIFCLALMRAASRPLPPFGLAEAPPEVPCEKSQDADVRHMMPAYSNSGAGLK